MDARLHPEKALGLTIGDSHMIRNAGGRVSPDALRSLSISQQLLGTNEIYIIHHTDCGMTCTRFCFVAGNNHKLNTSEDACFFAVCIRCCLYLMLFSFAQEC
jgi:carbonic anhydrase